MYHFRVFISYSHEDRKLAEQVVKVLKEMGLEPIWDKDIRPGMPFTEAIKGLIAHSHIFLPLITENSQNRPWVHQETGYAMAINVPVLPVAVGNLPGEMIAQLEAVSVKPNLEDLAERLQEANIEQVVFPPPAGPRAIVEVADWPETRTELMARYANRVTELGTYGRVRQRGILSSFSIPDKDIHDPIWKLRDGMRPRSSYYHYLLREERRALEVHARACGCSLILDLTLEFNTTGPIGKKTRLLILLEFLDSIADDKVRIVMSPRAREGNLNIIGDWFVAESLIPRPGKGYRQTIFSWHAPTVLRWVRRFDQEFEELYEQSGLGPDESRKAAMNKIEEIIESLPQCEPIECDSSGEVPKK